MAKRSSTAARMDAQSVIGVYDSKIATVHGMADDAYNIDFAEEILRKLLVERLRR
jgi:hypothetical protein